MILKLISLLAIKLAIAAPSEIEVCMVNLVPCPPEHSKVVRFDLDQVPPSTPGSAETSPAALPAPTEPGANERGPASIESPQSEDPAAPSAQNPSSTTESHNPSANSENHPPMEIEEASVGDRSPAAEEQEANPPTIAVNPVGETQRGPASEPETPHQGPSESQQ